MAHRLPDRITEALASVPIPPQARAALPTGSSNAQALFDPIQMAAIRSQLPPQAQAGFDQITIAIRGALASSLHDVFTYGAIVVAVGIVASVFLSEVPLRGRERRSPADAEADTAPVAAFGE
jgi:hypothetical protein